MADSTANTTPIVKPTSNWLKTIGSWIKSIYKHLFLDIKTLEVSFTKLWAELAGVLGLIITFQNQLVAFGIDIPSKFSIYFKMAAIASAIMSAIKMRNTISSNGQ